MADRASTKSPKHSTSAIVDSIAGSLAELDRAVESQAARFKAVLDVGAEISSAQDTDELLRLVMERLTAIVDAEASTLFVLDEARNELWSRVLKGSTLKEIRLPATAGIAGHVVSKGKTLLIGDAYSDVRFNPEIDRKSGFRTRSIVAAPLRHVSGRILGVVEVLDRGVDAFTEEDVGLVEAVASQIAAVLDNVRLVEQLKAQNEKLTRTGHQLGDAVRNLDVLYEVERAVSSEKDQTDLLDRILLKAIKVTGAEAGSILLLAESEDSLYFRSSAGEKSSDLVSITLKPGQGIAGHVAASGQTVRVEQAEASPHFERSIAKKLGVAVDAVLCVPIVGEGRRLGALELLNKTGGFTQEDERVVTLLSGQTGRAILLRAAREEGERRVRLAAIGQMLAGILHDVRTPMTVIAGYVELMVDEGDAAERKRAADVVLAQLEHLNSMTKETLAFARGESDVLIRKVYLQNFLDDVAKHLRQEFENARAELKVVANYTGAVRMDESKVKRVIYNIARNAIEAMPGGGRFTFSVDREGSEVVMRFVDTGPGIPEAIAGRLFQSFVTSGKANGTGLGLAISRKIAEDHKGSLTCRSKPGKGTTFELRIPAGVADT